MLENKYLLEITSILTEQLDQTQLELNQLRQRHPFWKKVKGILTSKNVRTHTDIKAIQLSAKHHKLAFHKQSRLYSKYNQAYNRPKSGP